MCPIVSKRPYCRSKNHERARYVMRFSRSLGSIRREAKSPQRSLPWHHGQLYTQIAARLPPGLRHTSGRKAWGGGTFRRWCTTTRYIGIPGRKHALPEESRNYWSCKPGNRVVLRPSLAFRARSFSSVAESNTCFPEKRKLVQMMPV